MYDVCWQLVGCRLQASKLSTCRCRVQCHPGTQPIPKLIRLIPYRIIRPYFEQKNAKIMDYRLGLRLGGEPNTKRCFFQVFFFGATLGRKAKKHGQGVQLVHKQVCGRQRQVEKKRLIMGDNPTSFSAVNRAFDLLVSGRVGHAP